ncbi:MAG: hypothetical protein ACJAUQ_001928, partial [Maribacter sp.]
VYIVCIKLSVKAILKYQSTKRQEKPLEIFWATRFAHAH